MTVTVVHRTWALYVKSYKILSFNEEMAEIDILFPQPLYLHSFRLGNTGFKPYRLLLW